MQINANDTAVQFNVNDKVYFTRGPMGFIGHVVEVRPTEVLVHGVEEGCVHSPFTTQTISYLAGLRKVSDDEWYTLMGAELAFRAKHK